MRERRKGKRVALLIDVAVDISCSQLWYNLESRNISTGGIRLKTDFSMPLETPVDIEIHLPSVTIPIEVIGEVVCRDYSHEEDYFYYGIMFLNLSNKNREIIHAYIEKHAHKSV